MRQVKLDRLYQPFQLHPAMTYKTNCNDTLLLISFLGRAECAKRLKNFLEACACPGREDAILSVETQEGVEGPTSHVLSMRGARAMTVPRCFAPHV